MAAIILALMALIVSCVGFYVTLVVCSDVGERCHDVIKISQEFHEDFVSVTKLNKELINAAHNQIDISKEVNGNAKEVIKLNKELIRKNEELTHYIYTKLDDVK